MGAGRHAALALAAVAFFTAACTQVEDEGKGSARNLIFIVIDTLRADQLALYGGPTATPHMEGLARRGVVFEHAYCHIPITGPSHASMFTSMLPSSHAVKNNAQVLHKKFTTLAELMSDSHLTAAFISLESLKSKYGILQGFDQIHEKFPRYWWKNAGELNEEILPWLDENSGKPFFLLAHYSDPHGPYTPPDWYQTMQVAVNDRPLSQILIDGRNQRVDLDLRDGENVVSFTNLGPHRIHLSRWKLPRGVSWRFGEGWEYDTDSRGKRKKGGPHGARVMVPGRTAYLLIESGGGGSSQIKVKSHFMLDAEEKRQGYAAETAYVDSKLGELFERMDRLKLWENTVVVLTADHGEELGRRDGTFEHVQRLYDSTVHVPLIIASPGSLDAGKRVSSVVRHIDLLPTMAEIFGLVVPGDARGADLFPLDKIGDRPAVIETYRKQARRDGESIRLGKYKLIRTHLKRGKIKEELYDMEEDRGERRDLIEGTRGTETRPGAKNDPDAGPGPSRSYEDLRNRLGHIMDGLRADAKKSSRSHSIEADLTEEDVEALQALGYLQ